jgi:hypothetical protein
MRRLILVIALGVLVAACGGAADSNGDEATDPPGGRAADTPNPCTLANDSILASYFGAEAVDEETSESGPIDNCSWRDANSNSLLIQVASDYALNRPDPCDSCIDLTFGDDGYATESILQSTAKWISGTTWYSVTTTGFGDDADSIASLAEKIFENATG